jgi:quinol-cytochrome oxidoreductase complex cytochrome b subunit
MSVNYRDQYTPDQLEPFFPNEIAKMVVAVLCTLAVIMFLAILPVLLESVGIHGIEHPEEPANPRGATPVGIKPEWYFLSVYQYLRLMPTDLLGISGKTLGVLSQGLFITPLVLLPFWYRKRANQRPGHAYRVVVTACLATFLILTIWGGWPETSGGEAHVARSGAHQLFKLPMAVIGLGIVLSLARRQYRMAGALVVCLLPAWLLLSLAADPELIPFGEYFREHPMIFILIAAALIVFYVLIAQERRAIRRVMGDGEDSGQSQERQP